ncbi:MAG TPA: NusG domain II-containing protein [Clostridiaceae bacterium]|nr:NusG domain II-containing protein [Clostridiaceae bacterium]
MKLKRNDIILITSLFIIAAVSFFCIQSMKKAGGTVSVLKNNQEIYNLPLNQDAAMTIEFNGQYNQLMIKDNKVWIESANCANQICVKHPKIQYSGETIICLPHQLVITIIDGEPIFDSFSY